VLAVILRGEKKSGMSWVTRGWKGASVILVPITSEEAKKVGSTSDLNDARGEWEIYARSLFLGKENEKLRKTRRGGRELQALNVARGSKRTAI